jgi:hypothetical protein
MDIPSIEYFQNAERECLIRIKAEKTISNYNMLARKAKLYFRTLKDTEIFVDYVSNFAQIRFVAKGNWYIPENFEIIK